MAFTDMIDVGIKLEKAGDGSYFTSESNSSATYIYDDETVALEEFQQF